ncbi:MAG: extracellular solute-binding protein [Bacilli bacterium]|nr:extracellular solute-binding protein [Bacilli bacterium]
MKFKFLKTVAPIAMVAMMGLTACGGKGLGSADTDKLDVTIETRGTTISFWTGFGTNINSVLQPILDEFSAKTGITVEYETKGGYSNLQTAINLSATKKAYANVAVGYPDHFSGYITQNIQLRLDGLIANDAKRAVKTEEGISYDKDGLMCLNYNDFYEDYRFENENLEFKQDGSGYKLGLPFNKSSEVMVYNKDFIDWCANQPELADSIYVPETWAQVKSVGLAVKEYFADIGVYGHILGDDGNVYAEDSNLPSGVKKILDMIQVADESKFHFISYDSTENLFITLVRQYGGTYTEVDKTKTGVGYAVFNDAEHKEKTLAAMGMLRDLWNNGLIGIAATFGEQSYCSNPFLSGKSLFNVGSTGGLTNVVGANFKTWAAPIPYVDASHKFVISQGTNLALFNKGTDAQKVASWKLMVYLSQQMNGAFCGNEKSGYFPTCEYAANSDEYQEYISSAFSGAAALQQEASKINSNTYKANFNRFVDPGFRGSSSIRTEVGYIPGYIFAGEYGGNDQAILNAVCTKLSDYIK